MGTFSTLGRLESQYTTVGRLESPYTTVGRLDWAIIPLWEARMGHYPVLGG